MLKYKICVKIEDSTQLQKAFNSFKMLRVVFNLVNTNIGLSYNNGGSIKCR